MRISRFEIISVKKTLVVDEPCDKHSKICYSITIYISI